MVNRMVPLVIFSIASEYMKVIAQIKFFHWNVQVLRGQIRQLAFSGQVVLDHYTNIKICLLVICRMVL